MTGWTVQSADGRIGPLPVPAPACLHLALQNAGLIRHPNLAGGEAGQLWVGRTDWVFRGVIPISRTQLSCAVVEVEFAFIDTAATVFVEGTEVGSVCNQFHPHRFPIPAVALTQLRESSAECVSVEVRCRAPVTEVESWAARLGARPVNGDWTPYVFLRKAACNFGWDWGPKVATCGVGGARVLAWDRCRIAAVRPIIRAGQGDAIVVDVHADLEWSAARTPIDLRLRLESPDGVVVAEGAASAEPGARTVRRELIVASPQLWWPRNRGSQPLYRLTVTASSAVGWQDTWRGRVGLRTVALNQEKDARGSRFAIEVNKVAVFCQGANWVPEGMYAGYASPGSVRQSLEAAAEAGINMLRVWGGGQYESREFYDTCDELGIMVWQDFMFACATYSEQEHFPKEIEAEARHQVSRLCAHPSVVLWCGGNENIWAWFSWGFGARLAEGQTWGRKYWTELLPAIVAELDPSRPYWQDSPYSGSLDRFPNDPDIGDNHAWEQPLDAERVSPPRFVSEFGRQAYPNLQTIREAVGEVNLAADCPEMQSRQKGTGGDDRLMNPSLASEFGSARSFAERVWQSLYLQARTAERGILWARANFPECAGALVWQWNDSWAGHGFGALDSSGRRKPLWHAIQRACEPRALAFCLPGAGGTPQGCPSTGSMDPSTSSMSSSTGSMCLVAMNDTPDEWRGMVRILGIASNGSVRDISSLQLLVPPWGRVTILNLASNQLDDSDVALVADCGILRACRLLTSTAEPSAYEPSAYEPSAYEPSAYEPSAADQQGAAASQPRCALRCLGDSGPAEGGGQSHRFHLAALTPLLHLWVEPHGDWREVSPNQFTLLPGETQEIVVATTGSVVSPKLTLWTPLGLVKIDE